MIFFIVFFSGRGFGVGIVGYVKRFFVERIKEFSGKEFKGINLGFEGLSRVEYRVCYLDCLLV